MKYLNLFLGAVLVVMNIGSAYAADRLTYEAKTFQEALAAGKPILVHVTASWCGTCKVQKPIVAALGAQREYMALTIFDVDFDTQKDAMRQLNIQQRSTLVVFKDKAEIARAVGITKHEAIQALMQKAL
jgi:thioredoxin 1